MQESAIKAWNRKKREGQTHSQQKISVPEEISTRQEQIKSLLIISGVKAPWDLPVSELYTVRALQLGAVF